jgi:hypothetical protein
MASCSSDDEDLSIQRLSLQIHSKLSLAAYACSIDLKKDVLDANVFILDLAVVKVLE